MKKLILNLIIILLCSFVAIATIELSNDKIKIDSINSITPTKEQKKNLDSYYFDKEKGMEEVTEYKKNKDHVVIYFNNTPWRVFTSKKHFNEVTK